MNIHHTLLEKAIDIKLNLISNLTNPAVPQSIIISSTFSREGNSTLVYSLGHALALDDSVSVLLVDANLRRPNLHNIFNQSLNIGFSDILQNKNDPLDSIKLTEQNNLHVLTAGNANTDLLHLFSNISKTIKNKLESHYDWIIYDTAPIGEFSDSYFLRSLADSFVLNIQADKSKCRDVYIAVKSFKSTDLTHLGTVLNWQK